MIATFDLSINIKETKCSFEKKRKKNTYISKKLMKMNKKYLIFL